MHTSNGAAHTTESGKLVKAKYERNKDSFFLNKPHGAT